MPLNEVDTIEDSYLNIKLSSFTGPLDLLVTLVRDKNINIWDVDLVELTNQYLKIIHNLQENDFDVASEYLVMASTLVYLKAKIALQEPEAQDELKKEKERLLSQIAEYEKFKILSARLKELENQRLQSYDKQPSDLRDFVKKIPEDTLVGHSSSQRLALMLKKMFERTYAENLKNISMSTKQVSPEEQKQRILELFKTKEKLLFEDIFTVPTWGHFVISLIALLDLSRQQILVINDNENIEIIEVTKGEKYGK